MLIFHGISTTLSHESAYTILEGLRRKMTDKLMKAPLGTVINQPIGQLKNQIIDRVETIERPIAHLIPEILPAMLLPMSIFIYIITIDWRMALASLLTIPIALIAYVTEGSISIGGVNIKDIPLEQLSDLVSFVTQDNFLFDCSILENIRLGNPKASDEDVYAAARAACCDEFVNQLERGYHTTAGEAGGRLSGGERQRIAIARAILKNAPIVILDEATAFTDPQNEDKIQRSIAELTKGKTLLVIAHRLSTIKNANQIVVLDQGKAEAVGTHEALLQSNRLYKTMWEAHINAKGWSANKGVL